MKENVEKFKINDKVTDGSITGRITRIFNSFDYTGKSTLCLSVRVDDKKYENFECTRAEWWEKIETK
jgi:hypothetical protein